MKQDLYTIQEVASLLGVSPKTLRRWEEIGKIKPIRTVGNQRRYLLEDVKKLERRRQLSQIKREVRAEVSPVSETSQVPTVSDQVIAPQAFSKRVSEVLNAPIPQAPRISEFVSSSISSSPVSEGTKNIQQESSSPKNNKPISHFAFLLGGGIAAFLLLFGIAFGLESASHPGSVLGTAQEKASTNNQAVLGASDAVSQYELGVNIPSVFGKQVKFLDSVSIEKALNVTGQATLSGGIKTDNANIDAGTGKITASNVIYSLLAGSNITISGNRQTPTISASLSAGVSSIQGTTGDVSLSNGSGISLNGLQINNTGVLSVGGQTGDVSLSAGNGIGISGTTITNTDTGSAQNIFKNFSISGTDITASNNNDTINFAAGSGITVTGDAGSNTITIAGSGGGLSGLTQNGVLYATSTSTAGTVVGTNGTVLHGITNGAPVFSSVDLTSDVSNILPVGNGGTGSGATPTNGELLIGTGSGYSLATIVQGNGIGVTNGSGSITLTNDGVLSLTGTANQVNVSGATGAITVSLPQNIANTSTPTFASLSLGATSNQLILGAGNTATITTGTLTNGRTYTLPDGSGTFCLVELNNCSGGGGGGGVGGSGSQNFIPLFTGATSLGDSDIYDNGKIGIGTTSPQGLFSVSGTALGFALAELNQTGTGDILTGSASGITRFAFDTSGNLTINGGSYEIGGTNVLSSTALGSSVVSSSLTSVGALDAGSIATGFGSITTGNTIQGTDITATGTTGLTASGNAAGLTFSGANNHIISASTGTLELGAATLTGALTGNGQDITGLNNLSAGGAISFTGLSTGIVTNTGGTLSSVSQLGIANGGTGTGTAFTQGSIVFAGATGAYSQDNANLFYNSNNALLGIGTNSPTSRLTVSGAIAGKALSVFNYTGTDQNILVASTSGTEEFAVNNNGSLQFTGGASVLQTLAVAATTNANTYTFPDAGGANVTVCLSTGNCLGGGGGGANISLSNLSGVAINTSLLPGSSNVIDLGSPTEQFRNAYVGSSLTISSTSNQIVFGNGTTGTLTWSPSSTNKTITFPNSTGTVCLVELGNCAGSGTGITGSGTATQLAYFSGPQALSSDSTLYFDSTNKLLGIGNATPVGKLDVKGAVTGKALAIFNETGDQAILTASASGTTEFTIDHSGNVTIAGNTITQGTTGDTYSGSGAGITFNGSSNHIISASSGTLELGAATLTGAIAGGGQNITGLGTINGLAITANTGTITSGTWNGTLISPQYGGTGINASGVTSGQLLIGNNSGGFNLNTLTGGAGINISNTSGTITISQTGSGASKFTENDSQGILYPNNSTLDVLFGGTATSSAKFGFLNVAGGTPVASISAGIAGSTYLTAAGILQTTAFQQLTLGGTSTGNIVLSPLNGAGTVSVNGVMNLSSGNSYQINGASVLNSNTLGSGVISSSLTSVGALVSGSIATGFGTILTNNTITGTTLNGTIGINTGTGVGTQRIDSSGDLVNIGNITASGTIQFSHFGIGIAHFDSSGNITSSQVDLTNANDIKNTLGAGNGGTGFATYTTGDLLYGNGGNTLSKLGIGSSGQILTVSGGTPQWISAGGTINFWQRNNNTVSPLNITDDLLLGGISTASAKFAFINNAGGTPTASISAGSTGALVLNATGTIQTTNAQSLLLNPNGLGVVGIGTTTPDAANELTVNGVIETLAGGGLQIDANDHSGNSFSLYSATGGLDFYGTTAEVAALTGQYGQLSIGVNNNVPQGQLDVLTEDFTLPGGYIHGSTGKATLILNQTSNTGDLFTASNSGATKFTILNNGNIQMNNYSTNNGLLYTNGSGVMQQLTPGLGSQCLMGNLTWTTCSAGANLWQENFGALSPANITDDLLLGGTSTASAKFAFTGVDTITPVASISAQNGPGTNGLSLNGGTSTIQSLNNNTLTIGGSSTGNISFQPGGQAAGNSLYLASNGQVGIGTTTPGGSLDIEGNPSTNLVLDNNNSNNSWINYEYNGTSEFHQFLNTNYMSFYDTTNSLYELVMKVGGSIGIGTNSPLATLDIRGNSATTPVASVSGVSNFANLVVDQSGSGDLFTASKSGATKFVINNAGNVQINNLGGGVVHSSATGILSSSGIVNGDLTAGSFTNITGVGTLTAGTWNATLIGSQYGGTGANLSAATVGEIPYFSGTGVMGAVAAGSTGQCLGGNGAAIPVWVTCAAGQNYWQMPNSGAIAPFSTTADLLLGGTATTSAKFAFINNVGSGTPTASISANSGNNATYLTGGGVLGTTNAQTLQLGSASTGNVLIESGGAGTVAINTQAMSGATGSISLQTGNSSTSLPGNITIDTGTGTLSGSTILNDTFEGTGTGSVNDMSTWFNDTVSASNTVAHTGSYSLKVTESAVTWGIQENCCTAFSVTPGHQYEFTSWWRGGTVAEPITVNINWVGAGTTVALNTVTDNTTGWTELSGEGIAPPGATFGYLTFVDTNANGANNQIQYVDDIVAMDVSSIAAPYISLGGTNAEVLTLGNLNAAGVTSLLGGGGGISLAAGADAAISIGTSSTNANNLTLGNSGGGIVNLQGLVGVGNSNTNPLATLDIKADSGILPVASVSGKTSFAGLVVDNSGAGDLFTASKSGATKFTILNNGNISLNNYNNCGLLTTTGTVLTCSSLPAGSVNYWQMPNSGAIAPFSTTADLLLGGTATTSAKFAFEGVDTTTPIASIGGNLSIAVPTGANPAALFNIFNGGSLNFQTSVGGNGGLASRLYLANNGNIGIGTTTPAGPLDISSTGAFGTFAQIETPGTGTTQQSFLTFVTKSDGTELGSSTNKGWQIGGRGDAFSGDPDNFFLDYWNGTAWSTNGIEMTPSGNLGLGTQSPLATLDVRGSSGTTPVASFSGKTSFASLIVDNSGSGDIFTASTSGQTRFTIKNSGVVVIGNNTNGIQFDPTFSTDCSGQAFAAVYCGTARPTKQIALTAEYAGAVLVASPSAGTNTNGFMTASASMSATPNSFDHETYYQWTSTQTNQLNQYTIALTLTLPSDFSGWPTSGNAMTIDFNTGTISSADNALDVYMYQKGDTSGVPVYFSTNNTSATTKNWTTVNITGAQLSGAKTWNSAGSQVTLYLTLKSWNDSANYVQVGDIKYKYLSGF